MNNSTKFSIGVIFTHIADPLCRVSSDSGHNDFKNLYAVYMCRCVLTSFQKIKIEKIKKNSNREMPSTAFHPAQRGDKNERNLGAV